MITLKGSTHIKRYIAGMVPSIAQAVAFGIGTTAESADDTKLNFEVSRADIRLKSFDFATNEVIFKTQVPSDFAGVITEVGLYSLSTDSRAAGFGSRIVSTFDQAREDWGDTATFDQAQSYVRLGSSSLSHGPAAGSTNTNTLDGMMMDMSGYSGLDKFVLALNASNANASNVKADFMTDSVNYYTVTFSSISSGYNVIEALKSSAVANGNPDWSNINQLRVTTTAKSGGSTVASLDGLRIDDADGTNPEYVLIARDVLDEPFIKRDGLVEEIEFRLAVNV